MLAGTLLVRCPVHGHKALAELHSAAACFTCVLSGCASCLKRGLHPLLQAVADLLRCRQGRRKPHCHAAEYGHGLQIHEPARLFRQVGCIRTGCCRAQ